jgi:hypothetical protein
LNSFFSKAVYGANWFASYDVRADTQTKQGTVTVLYKAAITQNTCEVIEFPANDGS